MPLQKWQWPEENETRVLESSLVNSAIRVCLPTVGEHVKEQSPEHNSDNGIVHWLLFGWHSYNAVVLTAVNMILVP